jgi:DNA ligase (NAD+)
MDCKTSLLKLKNYSNNDLINYLLTEKDLNHLHSLKIILDDLYYNTTLTECFNSNCFSDEQYDILKDIITTRDPDYIPPIGIRIRENSNDGTSREVNLPFFLPSIDKIKQNDNKKLQNWVKKNNDNLTLVPLITNYIITDKLDGVSCLMVIKNNKKKLYTRGDGNKGSDISYIYQYIKNVPKNVNNIVIRGELIISKVNFLKYSKIYSNARNMVSGLINSKSISEGLNDIEFIVYEIIENNELQNTPSSQLELLSNLRFSTPFFTTIIMLDIGILESYNIERKSSSLYEIDGIVIQSDIPYIRTINTNPKYSFAFKMTQISDIKKTTVLRVEWNVSKHGILKPRVEIEPVHIGGVIISYSSAFNAKYVIDNKICTGSIIGIIRSGDVIPYIVYVEKNDNNIGCMPDVKYKWNNSGIDILLDEEDNGEINIKLISGVFSKLNIKYISISTVRKLYINGLDTFLKIISASLNQLLEIFPEKTSNRIYKNIKDGLKNTVNLEDLLGSICIFGYGFGSKKIKKLLIHIPNLFEIYKTITKEELVSLILSIEGFSNITSKKIIDNILICDTFINDLKPYINFTKYSERVLTTGSNKLKNKNIVFSGFRDKLLEENIVSNGGKISLSVSKNTDILIVPTGETGPNSGKKIKALELNILIISKDDFNNYYL